MPNPQQALQLLLMGGKMAGKEIGELVEQFAIQKGLVPGAKAAVRGAEEALPQTVRNPIQAVQGELLTRAGQAQNFARGGTPFIRSTPVEEAYKISRPVAQSVADVPAVRLPNRPAPGQLSLGAAPVPQFKTTAIQGPISSEALRLFDTAPGEYKAIKDLAERASAYYGKPVTVSDLVAGGAGGGTNLLRTLETDLRKASAIVPSPGGAMRPPVPTALTQAGEQGGELATSQRGALINAILNRGRTADNILDVDVREIANGIGGLRQVNLAKLGAAAGIVGAGAAGFGLGRLSAPPVPATPGLPSQMGPTTSSPESGPINDPQVSQQTQANTLQTIAAGMSPGARANIPPATYTGAGGQPVMVTRGEDEALTSAKQQYAKPQGDLRKYYAQREAYANFPVYKNEIISELQKRGVLDTPELVTWAGANPTLAYELLRKATGSNTLPSQQVPQPTQAVTTTSMGTNNFNNMIGQSYASSDNFVYGKQGASDIQHATTPSLAEQISSLPTDFVAALQQRNLLRP